MTTKSDSNPLHEIKTLQGVANQRGQTRLMLLA